jgi:pimeloyl-ACP methyl ester carboxylesterase
MRLEVNGIGLEVEDRGVGPPIVLLHGWPAARRDQRPAPRLLAGALTTAAVAVRVINRNAWRRSVVEP